jgi:hypothetical protein
MEELLLEIVKISPIVGILAYFVHYFRGELGNKNAEIKELNQQLRDNQRETILAISKMVEVVTDLKELIKEKIK